MAARFQIPPAGLGVWQQKTTECRIDMKPVSAPVRGFKGLNHQIGSIDAS
jgi:hypothetical protein